MTHRMRNRLAHGYFAVDIDVVWQTLVDEIPDLKRQIEQLTRA